MDGAGAHSRVGTRRRREGEHGAFLGCGVGRFFMPLFTRVRGIGILRTSALRGSRKFARKGDTENELSCPPWERP